MTPPRLCETDGRVVKDGERSSQEVARRHEVRVEDRDKRRVGECQSVRQRPSLESLARFAPDLRQFQSPPSPVRNSSGEDGGCLVIGVVEDLDLEEGGGPVQLTDRVEDAFRDVAFVVDRDLDAQPRLRAACNQGTGTWLQVYRPP